MFGRTRVYETRPRPFAAFLLPSFPSLTWSRKVSNTTSEDYGRSPSTSPRDSIAVNSLTGDSGIHSYAETDSHRFSVASAASTASAATVTSTGSQATAPSLSTSLSTSPSSEISTTPRSLFSSPVTAPFPIFDTIDYQQPGFAEFQENNGEVIIETVETGVTSPSTYNKLGPQVETTPKRQNQSSPPSTTAAAAAVPSRRLERVFPTTLRCRRCSADLAFAAQIVSKGFTGRHGRAYLVSAPATAPDHLFSPEVKEVKDEDIPWDDDEDDDDDDEEEEEEGYNGGPSPRKFRPGGARDLPNITIGRAEHRRLVTGAHVVADISCAVCTTKLGWKYVDATDPAQRYKVGKFILEIARLATHHGWEDVPVAGGSDVSDVSEADGNGGGVDAAAEAAAAEAAAAVTDVETGPSAVSDPLGAVRQLMTRFQQLRTGEAAVDYYDEVGNENDDEEDADSDAYYSSKHGGPIEFDSDDEDECEDIFMGTWDAEVVARRRAAKRAESLVKSFKK